MLGLAAEHRDTASLIRASGLPHAILRNGRYTENYTASIAAALARGAMFGCARDGRIASAARADYAAAAAVVLRMAEIPKARIYELAGDDSYTLTEFASELVRRTGQIGCPNPVGRRHRRSFGKASRPC